MHFSSRKACLDPMSTLARSRGRFCQAELARCLVHVRNLCSGRKREWERLERVYERDSRPRGEIPFDFKAGRQTEQLDRGRTTDIVDASVSTQNKQRCSIGLLRWIDSWRQDPLPSPNVNARPINADPKEPDLARRFAVATCWLRLIHARRHGGYDSRWPSGPDGQGRCGCRRGTGRRRERHTDDRCAVDHDLRRSRREHGDDCGGRRAQKVDGRDSRTWKRHGDGRRLEGIDGRRRARKRDWAHSGRKANGGGSWALGRDSRPVWGRERQEK
jgi:hypothetical protein